MPATVTKRLRTLAVVIGPVAVCASWSGRHLGRRRRSGHSWRASARTLPMPSRAGVCASNSPPSNRSVEPGAGRFRGRSNQIARRIHGRQRRLLSGARMIRDIRASTGGRPARRPEGPRRMPIPIRCRRSRSPFCCRSTARNAVHVAAKRQKNRAALIVEFMSTTERASPSSSRTSTGMTTASTGQGPWRPEAGSGWTRRRTTCFASIAASTDWSTSGCRRGCKTDTISRLGS